VPHIATRLTPFVPYSLELRLGELIEAQARASLDTRHAGAAFECGNTAKEKPGRAAFDKLMSQLETAAGLPIPLHPLVVRQPEANAVTLPGGYIYVFQGLIDKAETPDELAGVIAHEVGHAAHRDGTRTVLQAAGLSLLFGILLGDFVGGGAVVFAAKTILQTSYSREVETAADAYGVMLMTGISGDARALGRFLLRIAGTTHPGPKILLDHPETRDRVTAIEGMAGSAPRRALLDQADWAALKSICSSS
jgi:Zn-dependent protease with chaperone function